MLFFLLWHVWHGLTITPFKAYDQRTLRFSMVLFHIRSLLIFAVSILLGVLILPMVNTTPLLNGGDNTEPISMIYTWSVLMSIGLLHFVDGWLNHSKDHKRCLRRLNWSALAGCLGLPIGFLIAAWPISSAQSDNLIIQLGIVSGTSGIFGTVLGHLFGHAVRTEHFPPTTRPKWITANR